MRQKYPYWIVLWKELRFKPPLGWSKAMRRGSGVYKNRTETYTDRDLLALNIFYIDRKAESGVKVYVVEAEGRQRKRVHGWRAEFGRRAR